MDTTQLFLSTADPHRGKNFVSFEQLRARLMFWALLVDEVVITDAIRNNNPTMRSLLAPDLYPPVGWHLHTCEPSVRALFEKEVLVVAERNGGTATKLFESQSGSAGAAQIDLPNLPYCKFVDATIGKRINFEGGKVANLFRDNLLSNLGKSIQNPRERGIPKRVSTWFMERVRNSDSVNLRELRDIIKNSSRYSLKRSVAYEIEKSGEMLSILFDDSYRANVPMSLGIKSEFFFPEDRSLLRDIQLGDNLREDLPCKERMRPTFVMDPVVLNSLPSHFVTHIRSLEISKQARHSVARAFGAAAFEIDETVSLLSQYFATIEDEIRKARPSGKFLAAIEKERKSNRDWNVFMGFAGIGISAIGFLLPVISFIGGLLLVAFSAGAEFSANRTFQRKARRLRNLVGTPRPLMIQ